MKNEKVAVSRTIKTLTTETNRPLDWYSTKNCALMYAKLLEKVDTPKRKRERGEPTNTNTVETPGEIVTKMLAKQRTEELRVLEAQSRTSYNHLRQQIQHLEAGMLDHTLDAEWEAFIRERKEEEEKERLHREWLKQREEKIHAIQKALKHQIPKEQMFKMSIHSVKRSSSSRRPMVCVTNSRDTRKHKFSDTNTAVLCSRQLSKVTPSIKKNQTTVTSDRITSTGWLFKIILNQNCHSITGKTLYTDFREYSFNLASARGRVGLSPNVSSALQNLVSSAISGTDATHKDHRQSTSTSPGSAAPTLSRLLELPPRPPGDPMPSITDLPPTHAETMAQVHKGSPPELKKPKLDIEALAAEAAESLLSDSLLNDLDDHLDDEEMDEEEEGKKEEELSSVSITPPETVSQEGGKTREHKGLEIREKDDLQKCSEGSSPETDTDVPLEEDKKGEETEQVGYKREEEEEEKEKGVEEKKNSSDTQHVEQESIDKEKENLKEREEFYKMKNAVVEVKDIMKDKKMENMIKKSESYNCNEKSNTTLNETNKETKNELENNNLDKEQKGQKYNVQSTEKSKDENLNKAENVEKRNTEKVSRKIDGSHKKKSKDREDERNKYKRNDKKKDKRSDKEHRKSKKNKKYKHKDKTESEKDESEKESKDKEKRSDKEKSKDRKGEKEKNKAKEKHKESRSERDRHKDKKDVEKGDKYKKGSKNDKDELSVEKKTDKHKSKHDNEKFKIKEGDNISKAESDKEKDIEECHDRLKERKSKSKRTADFQGEIGKNEKLDETKKKVENIANFNEGEKESKKLELQDNNQSDKLCEKKLEKDLSILDDNTIDTTLVVKTEIVESSLSVSYADKVKTNKKNIETNIAEDQMDAKENNKELEKNKVLTAEINLDPKNIEEQKSFSMDEDIESKENNFNVSNTNNTENEKYKSNKIQNTEQNASKVVDGNNKPENEDKQNRSSEDKGKLNSNQEKAASGGDMPDKLDDMNLKERIKKISNGGFGNADVFPAEDSSMEDSEQNEDIKDMNEDYLDSSKNRKEREVVFDKIIKMSSKEESKRNIEIKQEKSEIDANSLNISDSLKKEDDEVYENKNKKDEKEKKNHLEDLLSKMDDEDKKKKKRVDMEDEYINEDSRDVMSEEDMVHARGGKRKSSGSDLFAVASPFVPESNPCSPASTYYGDENDAEKAYRAWKKPIMILWNEIAAHKYASVFLRPITDEQAPGYHDVIHRPMDLKTIKARIENGTITNTSEFQRDIMLMFLNATMYNTSDHNVHQMASRMMKDTVASIESLSVGQLLERYCRVALRPPHNETRQNAGTKGQPESKFSRS
ncbi:unnamed protein product, partial [Meganyctiphanes norvegica]